MTRLATVSTVTIAILVLVGCGTGDHFDAYDMAMLPNGLTVDQDAHGLPDGHPPVGRDYLALPPGHPPLSDALPLLPEGHPALPEGHPPCPAGGSTLERPLEERWYSPAEAEAPLLSI